MISTFYISQKKHSLLSIPSVADNTAVSVVLNIYGDRILHMHSQVRVGNGNLDQLVDYARIG